MSEKLKYVPGLIIGVVILIGLILAGCSAEGTGSKTQETSSYPSQTTTTSEQSGNIPATTATDSDESGSSASPSQANAPSGPQGGPDMSKMFARAAEILGITGSPANQRFPAGTGERFRESPDWHTAIRDIWATAASATVRNIGPAASSTSVGNVRSAASATRPGAEPGEHAKGVQQDGRDTEYLGR